MSAESDESAVEMAARMKAFTVWLDASTQPQSTTSVTYDRPSFGAAYVRMDKHSNAKAASANRNRIVLCGAEAGLDHSGLQQIVASYRANDIERFFLWLSPGPRMATAREWIEACGFRRVEWTEYPTLIRSSELPLPACTTSLQVRKVTEGEIAAHEARLIETVQPEFFACAGCDNFHHYFVFDREVLIGAGVLAIHRDIAYLTYAATLEAFRRRGAQQALIAARAADARALGCSWLVSETLTMLPSSLANLERAGFIRTYDKEVYEWASNEHL